MPTTDIVTQLDTSDVAQGFNDFLASQGLGNMNKSTARRYREGVEASPMDDILAVNGYNFDEVFKKIPPEPSPLASLSNSYAGSDATNNENAQDISTAISSLGLNEKELQTLQSLIESGGSTTVGELPASMIQLLNKPGVNNAIELIQQTGEVSKLVNDQILPTSKDIPELMLEWMTKLGTDSSKVLVDYLKSNPTRIKEALRDPLTGITKPMMGTEILLQVSNAFSDDPIVGTPKSESLLASRAGGSRLTGGGGKDLFIISLSTNPFPIGTIIYDFKSDTGSKVVLDTSSYPLRISSRFMAAKDSRTLSRLSKTKTVLIFSEQDDKLLLNGNGKAKGLGVGNGGVIASFSTDLNLQPSDISLTFRVSCEAQLLQVAC